VPSVKSPELMQVFLVHEQKEKEKRNKERKEKLTTNLY
jgi:hypothetical protein